MENEPQPRFKLRFPDGTELICTRETTSVFLHSDIPEGDHIFVLGSIDPDDEPKGSYVFREQLENFDEITELMYDAGYYFAPVQPMTSFDRDTFDQYYARNHEPKRIELTPRQERLVDFVAYMLMKEKLTSDDFNGSGDLFI